MNNMAHGMDLGVFEIDKPAIQPNFFPKFSFGHKTYPLWNQITDIREQRREKRNQIKKESLQFSLSRITVLYCTCVFIGSVFCHLSSAIFVILYNSTLLGNQNLEDLLFTKFFSRKAVFFRGIKLYDAFIDGHRFIRQLIRPII